MGVTILTGDVMERLADLSDESVHCVVTSPPYWGLRDYGVAGQIGMELTLAEHIDALVKVFAEVRRVMRKDATLWLNYGDCYATAPNGRSAADTKALGGDDRTFRDKPFSTVGPIDRGKRTAKRWGGGNNPAQGYLKPKDLCMIPARLAIALQDDGWWLRSEIVWSKPNPMPESVTDRPTSAHEKIFLLTKSAKYYYDAEAVKTPAKYEHQSGMDESGFKVPQYFNGKHSDGFRSASKKRDKQRGHSRRHVGFNDRWDAIGANLRNVWHIATYPYAEAHFATFPPELIIPCIKAGCPEGGTVLDPFGGSGTTGLVADRLKRNAILIELNPEYVEMARNRIADDAGMFAEVATA